MCHKMYDIVMCMLSVGASADVKDAVGQTPLKAAKEGLAQAYFSEQKQSYKKVHEDTHIPSHTLILLMDADRNLVHFSIFVQHEFIQT